MKPIISPGELTAAMQNENLVLIDARTGAGIKESYLSTHLERAQHVNLEYDLSKPTDDAADGGRHPLPAIDDFAALLGKLGISKESHVVVYDDKQGANAAARFWWMLKAVGHEQVQVLDGGLQAALSAGVPAGYGEEAAVAAASPYPVTNWLLPMADIAEVERVATDPDHVVIDVRDAARYRGETEPIDLVAGHIPGAINIPLTENVNAEGFFLPGAALKAKYGAAIGDRDAGHVIVHCGSGVTACHTLLAIAQAGLELPKLYVGSWSEWSRTGREIGKGL
ncbi:sulfurtransferase [Hufsiella ginkgonis]|uniref:Sulfurtransferase n=1 Tax=Hufsiella ginkgonis TaxID=2695274 RepID=A0A7K1XV09_9SPHI|nr:sulfurtransferase [Hufsiella ginkgonis]MXV14845.1 sulfurtransferase [Hufsiella ginkgonis]